jgi:hypothetical protein
VLSDSGGPPGGFQPGRVKSRVILAGAGRICGLGPGRGGSAFAKLGNDSDPDAPSLARCTLHSHRDTLQPEWSRPAVQLGLGEAQAGKPKLFLLPGPPRRRAARAAAAQVPSESRP